jgi:peptide/nickel transport system permease protein
VSAPAAGTSTAGDNAPALPPSGTPLTPRRLARARRKAALARFWREFRRDRRGMAGLIVLAVMIAVALLAPVLANSRGLNPIYATATPNSEPSLHDLLGTDNDGRSVLILLIWGARNSLLVGFTATLISMLIGALVGVVAGHFGSIRARAGRLTDNLMMRATDWFLVVPFLPLAMVLARTIGPSLGVIILVIGLTSWAGTARIVRAQALAVETRPYLERAKALGAGHWHQMYRHVLPNVMPLLLANTILTVAGTILAETTLSFLGLGDPIRPTWGEMLGAAYSNGVGTGNIVWLLAPGIAVIVVVMAFTLVGHALEAVLDPKLRGR